MSGKNEQIDAPDAPDIGRSEVPGLGARLKEALRARRMRPGELAEACGVSAQAVSGWIRRERMTAPGIIRASDVLDVTTDYLLKGHGSIIGGDDLPLELREKGITYIDMGEAPAGRKFVVPDAAMSPSISEGDVVIVDEGLGKARPGDIALVVIGERETLRKLREFSATELELVPESSDYVAVRVPIEDSGVVGRVTEHRRILR